MWAQRVVANFGDVKISIIGKEDLIKLKKYANRLQDQIDIENLEKVSIASK